MMSHGPLVAALLLGAASAEVVTPSRPAVKSHRIMPGTSVDMLEAINAKLERQQQLIERQAAQIADLERVTPKEFEIVHYNVLADQSSSNLQPWFCYGANVTGAERAELTRRFYSGDKIDVDAPYRLLRKHLNKHHGKPGKELTGVLKFIWQLNGSEFAGNTAVCRYKNDEGIALLEVRTALADGVSLGNPHRKPGLTASKRASS